MAEKAAAQYEVTVQGTYYAGTKNNKIHRPYKPEKFVLHTLVNAQHTIYRKLIAQRLTTKYPDFVGVRTCEIIDTKTVTGAATQRALLDIPIAEMNLNQLIQFSLEQDLAVDPAKCGSVMAARKAVSDALDDKQLLKRQQDEEAAKRDREKKDKDNLDDLDRDPDAVQTDANATKAVAGVGHVSIPDPLDTLEDGQDPLDGLE